MQSGAMLQELDVLYRQAVRDVWYCQAVQDVRLCETSCTAKLCGLGSQSCVARTMNGHMRTLPAWGVRSRYLHNIWTGMKRVDTRHRLMSHVSLSICMPWKLSMANSSPGWVGRFKGQSSNSSAVGREEAASGGLVGAPGSCCEAEATGCGECCISTLGLHTADADDGCGAKAGCGVEAGCGAEADVEPGASTAAVAEGSMVHTFNTALRCFCSWVAGFVKLTST